ncbi:MAG: hypothetical protein DRJ10_01225 [Bacteroidetes bacterium]|nr:MAG: hypothetical protein DRJ10_01225 [Bacteroidota bacterium]
MQIKAIYDNKGETCDRYSIVFKEKEGDYNIHLGLSNEPTHPQGFSQWSQCVDGDHLGTKIDFSELPINIQEHILKRRKE